jgi:hypothetical protein
VRVVLKFAQTRPRLLVIIAARSLLVHWALVCSHLPLSRRTPSLLDSQAKSLIRILLAVDFPRL